MTKMFFLLLLSLLTCSHGAVAQESFVDDAGQTHPCYTGNKKPKIVGNAMIVTSLFHMGLEPDRVAGFWGTPFIRSSNKYDDPNIAESIFGGSDPTIEDVKKLQQTVELTPGCMANKGNSSFCDVGTGDRADNFDVETFNKLEYDVSIFIGNSFNYEHVERMDTITGHQHIILSNNQGGPSHCTDWQGAQSSGDPSQCLALSYIDIVNKIHDLAKCLNVDTSSVERDRQAMCTAAEEFTEVSRSVAEKGMRFAGGLIGATGGISAFISSPRTFTMLRTLEELGLPLYHPGRCMGVINNETLCYPFGPGVEVLTKETYFLGCEADQDPATCNDDVLYPIDFWFIEGRTFLTALSPDFQLLFPDKAFQENQFFYMIVNEGTYSYRVVANFLGELTVKLAQSKKLHSTTTPCVPIDYQDPTHITPAGEGLIPGDVACYNEQYIQALYTDCPAVYPVDAPTPAGGAPTRAGGAPTPAGEGDPVSSAAAKAALSSLSVTGLLLCFV